MVSAVPEVLGVLILSRFFFPPNPVCWAVRSLQTPLPLSGLGSLDLTQNLSPECATLSLLPWRFPHVSCASFPVPMCGGIAFKPPILRTSLWLDGVGSWAWRECCTGLAVCHLRPFSQPAPCPVPHQVTVSLS